jgi:CBS-domain-containing membrane protein
MKHDASAAAARSAEVADPWKRPIRDFPGLTHLAPPIAHPNDEVRMVIEALSRDLGASAIFVVDDDDKLVGCIREQALDADLVTLVIPQHLWPSITEMDTRTALRAARGPVRKACELMAAVRAVTPESKLVEAVGLMIRSAQPTVPLVDREGRLLGYLRLFEVLAHFLREN